MAVTKGKRRQVSKRASRKRESSQPMDVGCLTQRTAKLDQVLRSRVIGQEPSIGTLVCSFARVLSGLRDPARPVLTMLMLGPTGVGKTETAKALAQTLFGSERALARVNCGEYAHGHELSKLLGSPPGYVGHNIEPLLSQARLDRPHIEAFANQRGIVGEGGEPGLNRLFAPEAGNCLSIVLFDEIEKAHPAIWNALLGILEDGMLTLGDNSTTDFTRSIIMLTSNVGSSEMDEILQRRLIGFRGDPEPEPASRSLEETARAAAAAVFPFEFLNRLDEILVFSPLDSHHLEGIFDKFLGDIHARALQEAGIPLLVKPSVQAKRLIIERGTDARYGARPLRRAMEKLLVDPLSRLIASEKVRAGDVIEVEMEGAELRFMRATRSDASVVA